jgi:hypothetical protein
VLLEVANSLRALYMESGPNALAKRLSPAREPAAGLRPNRDHGRCTNNAAGRAPRVVRRQGRRLAPPAIRSP